MKKNLLWLVAVVVATIPLFWNLLRPGFFYMQDDLQAFRIQQLDKCLSDFQIPCRWIPDGGYGYGYPQFNYYPPSVYYAGAVLHRVGLQYIDAVKVLFILGYIVSAVTMFVFVKSLLGEWPAFVASVLYSYIPYKAVEVYVRGAMSEFWSLALFPLIFWAIYKSIKENKNRYYLWFSVSVGLLLLTHNLMTLIFAPVAVIWTIYWILVEKKIRLWSKFAGFGLLGFGLASTFTLPVIFESKFVHVDSVLSGYFDYRAHFVSLYKLFISREWGYGSSGFPDEKLNLSVGIVQWIVGLVAAILAVKNIKKHKKFSVLVLLLFFLSLITLFMIHMKSSFIWVHLPVLWWLQFPWRFLSVAIFLLAILCGLAVYLSGRFKFIFGSLLVLASIILNIGFFVPKDWLNITDGIKFSGISWQKQMTISIFDYLPIYAKFPPITQAPDKPEILEGEALILNYEKKSNSQRGEVEVVKDVTLRLPLYDFPGMKVLVNGEKIEHYNDDCREQDFCYGLISFRLPVGKHIVEAKLTNTPIRIMANLITATSMCVLIWLIFKKNEKIIKK